MKYDVDKELRILKRLKYQTFSNRRRILTNMLMNISMFVVRPIKGVKLKRYRIKGFQNKKIRIYVLTKRKEQKQQNALLYMHGGSFQLEGTPFHIKNISKLVYNTGNVAIYVKYRLAPKHRFPVGLEDSYKAYLWIRDNEKKLNITHKKITVAGDSAGGNLAIGVALLVRDRLKESVHKIMVLYPVIDHRQITQSMKVYDDTPVFNSLLNKDMWETYLEDFNTKMLGYASFLISDLSGLPETYIETAQYDCLRDEGILFAQKLKSLGTKVYERHTLHSVHGYDGVFYSQFMKDRISDRSAFLSEDLKE